MSDASAASFTAEELLGPLNDFERKHAPKRLWATGDVELLRTLPRVAIVGSRRASEAGRKRAARLARELVDSNVVVVSGLAEGIDTAAHAEAIGRGGRTIAVLGTPLDQCFPRENAALQERIAREHLVLSQFEPGTVVARGNFPMRNRLMALVAHATVIVEAKEGSGTIHQAWEAIRLGRPLFLMRSMVESRSPPWTADLIEHGAIALHATQQVIDAVPLHRKARLAEVPV